MKIVLMNLSDIKPYKKNPRKITDEAIEKVAESIRANGFNQAIVVDQKGIICVGHTRYLAAKKLGLKKVPVFKRKFTAEQFRKYNIADNKTGEFSSWNLPELRTEIKAIKSKFSIEGLGFDVEQIESLVNGPDKETKEKKKVEFEASQESEKEGFILIVKCENKDSQLKLFSELDGRNFNCQIVD